MEELVQQLMKVIEGNTEAMNRVSAAVEADAAASEKMADQVKSLRAVITATQRKIGGELGPIIDRSKATLNALETEREEVRRAASQTTERSGSASRVSS